MSEHQRVVVTDVAMPLKSMIVFMLKWLFATVCASVILFGGAALVVMVFFIANH